MFALDTVAMEQVLEQSLRRHGVVNTWDSLICPAFGAIAERQATTGKCIDVEHAFSWIVSRSLQRFPTFAFRGRPAVPLILACMENETHTLPLEALCAALAQQHRPTLMLGASVPTSAVLDALRQQPRRAAAMLWAQSRSTADAKALDAIQSAACYVIIGGPGWQGISIPRATLRVASLAAAFEAVMTGI
jgi:MerR family transcriptional regulator, light-induced transcriptional regulator